MNPSPPDWSVDGFLVHTTAEQPAGGDLRQGMVGMAFLLEGLVEQVGSFIIAERVGEGFRHSIRGDLLVLHAVRGGDEDGVAHVTGCRAGQMLFRLLDEPAHRFTFLTGRVDVQVSADPLKTLAMFARFFEMLRKGVLQVLVGGVGYHLRQCGDELRFRAVKVAQLVLIQLLEIVDHGFGRLRSEVSRGNTPGAHGHFRRMRAGCGNRWGTSGRVE